MSMGGSKRANFTLFSFLLLGLFQVGCAGIAQSQGTPNGTSNSLSGSQGSQPQTLDLYLPSLADCAVPSYSIDPSSGLLTPLPGAPFPTGANSVAQALTEDPAQRFFFAGNVPSYPHGIQAGDPSVSVFKRNASTGVLTLQQSGILITPDPVSLAVDESGKFLYSNGYFTAGGHVFSIDQTSGTLTEVNGSPFPALLGDQLVAHPSMPFLYSIGVFGGKIYAFRLDENSGEPTPLPGSPFSMSALAPSADAIDPAGHFLYVLDGGRPNLYVFRIQSDGTLASVPGSPFEVGQGGLSMATSPSGSFLYVTTSEDGSNLYGFRINRSTGQIAQVSHVGVPNTWLTIAAIDRSGRFLYASEANDLYLFTIDETTGALTFKGSARTSTP